MKFWLVVAGLLLTVYSYNEYQDNEKIGQIVAAEYACKADPVCRSASANDEASFQSTRRDKLTLGNAPQVRSARRTDIYLIETSHNDEFFIINGEKFEAQAFCFDMEEDDEVVFLDGSPLGVCTSATLLNLRTRDTCEVWCE